VHARKSRYRSVIGLSVLSLLAALVAAIVPSSAGVFASTSSGSDKTTSTGVRTSGAIKTTQYTIGWLLRCKYSKSLPDDPIVHAGMPGMSHNHDFFGNVSITANSSYKSMIAAKTTCLTAADTASYWQPTLRELVGGQWRTVTPDTTGQQIYYRGRYAKGVTVVPMPPDLRIITGNAMATSVAQNAALSSGRIRWTCVGNDKKYPSPPLSCTGAVEENVAFPSCWDGKLTHSNDSAHVAYAPDLGRCPQGFPIAMPRISLKVKFPVLKGTTSFALASGDTYTAHADFWNTWQQNGLAYLVSRCINAGVSCGTNPVAPMGG
jgi:hypothetical protein